MKNIYHAEMALLIRREKEIEEKLVALRDDFGTWKERVQLAKNTGRDELVGKAEERIEKLRTEVRELRDELRLLVVKKKRLRKESRRPTGIEVQRSEALLESFRQSGLIDPEEATMESEFDELRRKGYDSEGETKLDFGDADLDEPDNT